MLDGMVHAEAGPVYYRDLVTSEANFRGLREFAHAWHRRRSCSEVRRGQRGRRGGEEVQGERADEEDSRSSIEEGSDISTEDERASTIAEVGNRRHHDRRRESAVLCRLPQKGESDRDRDKEMTEK
ncbi:uncharacterized protein LOC123878693 isoform X1 [Maniola jurtina]|uniref:uncharacterized protein LOC123878693 isoform X1 n=1 Tax=Maniola jurtina TaxID=191418 RepID=UPI001E68D227|nr:uncharacterized protein LOC123878693 isoform X1 [Maniola jurtina]XP_045781964.1 uncharacterized protein LOC123878693 isoform X1 [Maniola jurtina]